MVNFKDKLFKSKDDKSSSLSRKQESGKEVRPPSGASFSSTRSFSIFGPSPSPGPSTRSPTPQKENLTSNSLRRRHASAGGTSSSYLESTSASRSRSRSGSPSKSPTSVAPPPPLQPPPTLLWGWKIQEPSIKSDEIDYSEYLECFGCKKPIYKDMVQLEALEKLWHPECFHCGKCTKVLTPPEKFFELNGKPYCEADYNEMVYPKCYVCTKTIFENEVKVLQRSYHPNCFTCRKCSQPLCPYTNNYIERNGTFYCEEDYHDLFSPKCYECDEPIRDQRTMTRALGTTYHREHFTCTECKQPLPGNNIWKKNGRFYCEDDYHKLFSPVCAGCFEPIRHNGIMALGQSWHDDCCLRCGACQKILKEDNYIQHEDKAYCRNDWVKLFGPKCAECRRPIFETLRGEGIIAMGLDFHPGCFRCYDCLRALDENTFYEYNRRPYCHEHYHSKTCPDCIKKAEQLKIMKQQSIDQYFDDQIYAGSKKIVKADKKSINKQDSNKERERSSSRMTTTSAGTGTTISQQTYRSRSMSPIDYFFRPKSSQSNKK